MGITLTRSTDIHTCAVLLPDVYQSLERKESPRTKALSSPNHQHNGDQEAFYLEWTEGAYHHLRVMPLTEEYYCPQVPVVKGGAVWTTSWSFKRAAAAGGRLAHRPYKCRAVTGTTTRPER